MYYKIVLMKRLIREAAETMVAKPGDIYND